MPEIRMNSLKSLAMNCGPLYQGADVAPMWNREVRLSY